MLFVFLAFAGLLVAWAVWQGLRLPGSFAWLARRKAERHASRLAAMSAAELASEALRRIRGEGWDSFSTAGAFATERSWTDETLAAALEEFRVELLASEPPSMRPSREGNVFEWYDCGLALIAEILQKRAR